MLETVVVLETIALEAVETDMGQPRQTEGKNERSVLSPADADRHCRQRCGVRGVVEEGTETGAAEISRPRQVRQQDEGGHQPPRLAGGGEDQQGSNEENEGLDSEPYPRPFRHVALGRRVAKCRPFADLLGGGRCQEMGVVMTLLRCRRPVVAQSDRSS